MSTNRGSRHDGDSRSTSFFVGQLPLDVKFSELQEAFARVGRVVDFRQVRGSDGVPRNFGFITFARGSPDATTKGSFTVRGRPVTVRIPAGQNAKDNAATKGGDHHRRHDKPGSSDRKHRRREDRRRSPRGRSRSRSLSTSSDSSHHSRRHRHRREGSGERWNRRENSRQAPQEELEDPTSVVACPRDRVPPLPIPPTAIPKDALQPSHPLSVPASPRPSVSHNEDSAAPVPYAPHPAHRFPHVPTAPERTEAVTTPSTASTAAGGAHQSPAPPVPSTPPGPVDTPKSDGINQPPPAPPTVSAAPTATSGPQATLAPHVPAPVSVPVPAPAPVPDLTFLNAENDLFVCLPIALCPPQFYCGDPRIFAARLDRTRVGALNIVGPVLQTAPQSAAAASAGAVAVPTAATTTLAPPPPPPTPVPPAPPVMGNGTVPVPHPMGRGGPPPMMMHDMMRGMMRGMDPRFGGFNPMDPFMMGGGGMRGGHGPPPPPDSSGSRRYPR